MPAQLGLGERLIAGRFEVSGREAPPTCGGGLPGFLATDLRTGSQDFVAVQVQADRPPRAQALTSLAAVTIPGIALPLASGLAVVGDGQPGRFVVSRIPAGAPLGQAGSLTRPWTEGDILADVLRSCAAALAALHAIGITHRAIRPDNIFQEGPGKAVTLGAAWAAPPASMQPAVFEPPYAAVCPPCARGDGEAGDDIYALGVLLVVLASGVRPLADLDEAAMIRRILSDGSFKALTAGLRLPPMIADLARGMLAEDPDHRPTAAQLQNPAVVRGRRVAARPARKAPSPIEIADRQIFDVRSLAHELSLSREAALRALRTGVVEHWLRRCLGEPALALRVADQVRMRPRERASGDDVADDLLLTCAVATLDPLAPLSWRGLYLWPDGLGAVLAASGPAEAGALHRLVATDVIATWAGVRRERRDPEPMRALARQHRTILSRPGWGGGIPALRYALNPHLRCRSGLFADLAVVRIDELLPALERAAGAGSTRPALPLDVEIAAFLAARLGLRADLRADRLFGQIGGLADATTGLAQLELLAGLQIKLEAEPLPLLTGWLAEAVKPALLLIRSRTRRAGAEARLAGAAGSGLLLELLRATTDPDERQRDEREASEAEALVARIDAELASLGAGQGSRADAAREAGQAVASALTLAAAAASALALLVAG